MTSEIGTLIIRAGMAPQQTPSPGSCSWWLRGRRRRDRVFARDQSALIRACRHVIETDIVGHGTEERNPAPEEYGDPGDRETLNDPGCEEALHGDPAIHVGMPEPALRQPRYDIGGRP